MVSTELVEALQAVALGTKLAAAPQPVATVPAGAQPNQGSGDGPPAPPQFDEVK